jgi:predicted permease
MQDTGTGTTAAPRARRTLGLLVGTEFALAALLLVCGGLLAKAYSNTQRVDPGFRPEGVLTFGLSVPGPQGDEAAWGKRVVAFWDEALRRLAALPGVEAASAVTCPPLFGCHWGQFYEAEGEPPRRDDKGRPVVLNRAASADYFRTMGLRLHAGRFFEQADGRHEGQRVAIVNETFVRTFLSHVANPIGHRVKYPGAGEQWITVVGVVGDVRHYGLDRPMRPGIYLPLPQVPMDTLFFTIRTTGNPASLVSPARDVIRGLDPTLPLFRVRTMEEVVHQSLLSRAAVSWLLGVFAILALILALGGSYGVTTYLVSQRRRELSIRSALGARSADVLRTVLAPGMTLVAIGIGLGLVASLGAGRLLRGLLYAVDPGDLLTLVGVAALLIVAGFVANWIPARRAARIDPATMLRSE